MVVIQKCIKKIKNYSEKIQLNWSEGGRDAWMRSPNRPPGIKRRGSRKVGVVEAKTRGRAAWGGHGGGAQ